uniref:Uncharacterized protein n=1 Tax=viral metagenome TaxID=1070528 RepID=A0A6M3KHH6_9ZZZZ
MQASHTMALILYNTMIATSPSYKQDQAAKKGRMWTQFLDSLEWGKVKKDTKSPSVSDLRKTFTLAGIPVKVINKGD